MGACILQEGHSSGLEVRYQATLSGDGTATPQLTKVQVTFSGDNPTTEYDYSYDAAGNMTSVDTITAAGTATEVRDNPSWPAADQINALNQILRNDVTPAGGSTTTHRYTYNADGTMATRTDGTTTWTYNWDPVGTQRLLSVDIDGVTQVAYTYDSLGRMLTRTPYSGGVAGTPTSFEWDGMTVVRETTPNGVYRYYAPQGELITFDYTPDGGETASYSAHADAIGSVRAITDSTGALVAHFEYDAWGTLLPTSNFGPLPDWSYLFVGSLGVRWDAATGLYYMRQRWYDPGLQRFVSRDPFGLAGSLNLYGYANASPVNTVDPSGEFVLMGVIAGVAAAIAVAAAAASATLSLERWLAARQPPSNADITGALQSVTMARRPELQEILRYWQKEYPEITDPRCEVAAARTQKVLESRFHDQFKNVIFGQDIRYHNLGPLTPPTNYATIQFKKGGSTIWLYAGSSRGLFHETPAIQTVNPPGSSYSKTFFTGF